MVYVWGIAFFPTMLTAQDFSDDFNWSEESTKTISVFTESDDYSVIFENMPAPSLDLEFGGDDFTSFKKEDIVLKALEITQSQLDSGCPICGGKLSVDASGKVTCENAGCALNSEGAFLITESPIGDGLFILLFAAFLYFCFCCHDFSFSFAFRRNSL